MCACTIWQAVLNFLFVGLSVLSNCLPVRLSVFFFFNCLSVFAFGWTLEDDAYIPIMTKLKPAPDSILQLVKSGCKKVKCIYCRCKGKSKSCFVQSYEAGEELCNNVAQEPIECD